MICPSHDNGARRHVAIVRALPLVMAALMMAISPALAADWPSEGPLRGSYEPPAAAGNQGLRWDGLNFGATFGLMNMYGTYGSSAGSVVSDLLATDTGSTLTQEYAPGSWVNAPSGNPTGRSYGGFIGYTTQFDDVIIGVDLGYNKANMENAAVDNVNRVVTTANDGVQHNVTLNTVASVKLVDYVTLRARTGFTFGQFLPYVFVGGAVGRFNHTRSATVTDVQTPGFGPVTTFGPVSATSGQENLFVGGFTGGLGIDVALTPNIFLRAEYEYVGFAKFQGVTPAFGTGRVGVGVRF